MVFVSVDIFKLTFVGVAFIVMCAQCNFPHSSHHMTHDLISVLRVCVTCHRASPVAMHVPKRHKVSYQQVKNLRSSLKKASAMASQEESEKNPTQPVMFAALVSCVW